MANPNWKKGQSGNINGRPKSLPGFKEDCREWAKTKGLPFLKQIASDKDHPHRLAAIIYMVDHGYGKPQASVDHSGGVTLLNLLNADGVEK